MQLYLWKVITILTGTCSAHMTFPCIFSVKKMLLSPWKCHRVITNVDGIKWQRDGGNDKGDGLPRPAAVRRPGLVTESRESRAVSFTQRGAIPLTRKFSTSLAKPLYMHVKLWTEHRESWLRTSNIVLVLVNWLRHGVVMKKGGEADAVEVPKEDGEEMETLKRIRVEHGEAAEVEEEVST